MQEMSLSVDEDVRQRIGSTLMVTLHGDDATINSATILSKARISAVLASAVGDAPEQLRRLADYLARRIVRALGAPTEDDMAEAYRQLSQHRRYSGPDPGTASPSPFLSLTADFIKDNFCGGQTHTHTHARTHARSPPRNATVRNMVVSAGQSIRAESRIRISS